MLAQSWIIFFLEIRFAMADHCYWDYKEENQPTNKQNKQTNQTNQKPKHFKIVFSETEKGNGRKHTPKISRTILTSQFCYHLSSNSNQNQPFIQWSIYAVTTISTALGRYVLHSEKKLYLLCSLYSALQNHTLLQMKSLWHTVSQFELTGSESILLLLMHQI